MGGEIKLELILNLYQESLVESISKDFTRLSQSMNPLLMGILDGSHTKTHMVAGSVIYSLWFDKSLNLCMTMRKLNSTKEVLEEIIKKMT